MKLLDANVVIRYLSDEESDQNRRALALLASLTTGNDQAMLPECVLAEIVFVLSSRNLYGLSRQEIVKRLSPIIEFRGIQMAGKAAYTEALRVYASTSLDFPDCICVGLMRTKGIREIVSFDRDFDRFDDIVRVEP
ncbi:MAG: PIN domain-containing protein [Thermomicrobiales bacterium]|nr:PIN domain-containing protein [Thermomicrobiales bacterium]